MDTFSERLKSAMAAKGMKQVDLIHAAEQKGVKLGKSHVSQYVSGKTIPRNDIMAFLAETLSVEKAWLRGEQNPNHETAMSSDVVMPMNTKRVQEKRCEEPKSTDAPSEIQNEKPVAPIQSTASESKAEVSDGESKQKSKLQDLLTSYRSTLAVEAAQMEREGTRILNLTCTDPAAFGFYAPDELISDGRRQMAESVCASTAEGLFAARKAILQYTRRKGVTGLALEDVFTGNDVSELAGLSMAALLNSGDEVLVPAPGNILWEAAAILAGGKVVRYRCDEDSDWYPDVRDLESKVTPKTKALVIINPNDSTGAVYSKSILEAMLNVARQYHLTVLSDETDEMLAMDGEMPVSAASLAPDLLCLTFSGLSKSYAVTGFRSGWMVLSGNKNIERDFRETLQMLAGIRLCSNMPGQSIIQTALGGMPGINTSANGRLCRQRDYICDALNEIDGISVVKPRAGFCAFPRIDKRILAQCDDRTFAAELLREQHVLVMPGSACGWGAGDHFKLSFLPPIEILHTAIERISDFLTSFR